MIRILIPRTNACTVLQVRNTLYLNIHCCIRRVQHTYLLYVRMHARYAYGYCYFLHSNTYSYRIIVYIHTTHTKQGKGVAMYAIASLHVIVAISILLTG